MCGIVSVLKPSGGLEEPTLRRALAALRHRGPDGEGVWLAPDRQVGLGHVRLAVVDLETGAQPILSEDGQTCIVVNGEFYGFEDERRDLKRRGHCFRTRGDSEIALHLYEAHGIGFLSRLRGEFALVLWDGHKRLLLAARDRFGIKPLCYVRSAAGLALASEAKALFALGMRPAWDHEAFFQVAGMQYLPADRTLFEGVRQVRPGHYLLARDGAVETAAYWDLDYPPAGQGLAAQGSPQAHADELRQRFDEAVRLRLRADVPVCFHLSGGLDSSSVVAVAARHLPKPPPCFCVSFGADGYDELELARQMASRVGAALHPVTVSQADLLAHLSDAVYFSEGLAINGHLPAKFLLARAIRQAGFKVVLSGEGADELLGGYAHLRRDLFLSSKGLDDPGPQVAELLASNAVMAGIQLAEGEALPLAAVQERLGFVPSFLEAKATLGFRLRQVLSRDFQAAFAGLDPFRIFLDQFDVPERLAGRHPVDQASYLWTKSALANYILRTLGDGTEMAHAVEGRLPFLDPVLVDFVRRLPVAEKIQGTTEKVILREALGPLLPEAIRRRAKHPFTAPPLSRFSNPALDAFLQDVFRSRPFAALPFFDVGKILRLLEQLPNMPPREQVATDPVLMIALTAWMLQQRFAL